jgi:hypothetical protein
MRIVAEIPHPHYKITLFYHNSKYTLQIESDLCTQSYQFRESPWLTSAHTLVELVSQDSILKEIEKQFLTMHPILEKLTPKGPPQEDLPSIL